MLAFHYVSKRRGFDSRSVYFVDSASKSCVLHAPHHFISKHAVSKFGFTSVCFSFLRYHYDWDSGCATSAQTSQACFCPAWLQVRFNLDFCTRRATTRRSHVKRDRDLHLMPQESCSEASRHSTLCEVRASHSSLLCY